MTLEVGPTPTAGGTPSANDPSAGRAKAHGGNAAGGNAPSGFLAILAALSGVAKAGAGSDQALDPSQQSFLADGEAKDGHGGARPLTTAKGGHRSGVGANADGDTDAKSMMDGMAPPAAGAPDASTLAQPTDATALLTQSAQWSTAATVTVALPATDATKTKPAVTAVAENLTGAKRALPLATSDEPAVAAAASGEASLAASTRAAKAQKDAVGRLAVANADVATQVSVAQADPRNLQVAPKAADVPTAALVAALVVAGEAASTRRDSGTRERAGFRTSAADNATVPQSYAPTGAGATSQATVDAPSPTDSLVAEKVAYWISNDVQNAQMKLDGIGDKPVEVSIRMQGNEAHIAFRTDELQAQAALESASAHLKDLLQREGLVLSGVSVGSSGANGSGGAGDPQSGARQGVRQQATVVASVQSPASADRGAGRATGSALDLFV